MSAVPSAAVPDLFFVDRSSRGRLRLTGRDRQSFLQGMVTNDVARLMPGQGCYAFQLDATGHVLADMRVLCAEDYLLLDVEPGLAPQVAETLERYLIMERCRIADVSREVGQFLVGGTRAAAFLAEHYGIQGAEVWGEGANAKSSVHDQTDDLFARSDLIALPAFDVYMPQAYNRDVYLHALMKEANGVEMPPETLDALRVEAGVPRFGVDMDARVLAPETGQQSRAISYRKGCYIGQEIVARIDARGHTNRTFAGFRLNGGGDLPAPETPVVAEDGREVGRVTSVAVGPMVGVPIALGYVRHEHAAPGTSVTIGGQPAIVALLPFAKE
jgi:folate-binding protein YgfZ